MITLKPYGADNTGQLIDAVKNARSRRENLMLVSDTYVIQDKIELTQKESFQSISMIGERSGYNHEPAFGTRFDCSAIDDGNCFEINSGRNVTLSNFAIFGNGVSNGIVIDGEGTLKGSSIVFLENLSVGKLDRNIIISQSEVSQNADRVAITDCQLGESNICVSIGQTQSRALVITRGHIGNCLTGVSGYADGIKKGCPPKIYGTQFDTMERMFDVPSNTGEPMLVSGVHAERVGGIGRLGVNASSRQPVLFESCGIDLAAINAPATDDEYCLYSGTVVKFIACALGSPNRPMKVFAVSFDATAIAESVDIQKMAASPDPNYEFIGFCYPER